MMVELFLFLLFAAAFFVLGLLTFALYCYTDSTVMDILLIFGAIVFGLLGLGFTVMFIADLLKLSGLA